MTRPRHLYIHNVFCSERADFAKICLIHSKFNRSLKPKIPPLPKRRGSFERESMMAARVNSSTNILVRSSQEAFKADALTQKKCMLLKDPMKPVKPFSDCAQRRLNVQNQGLMYSTIKVRERHPRPHHEGATEFAQPDHDISYHPSVYKVLRSSAVGEKGSDHRHAIKCNSLCTTFYHCRYCGIHN